MTITDSVKIADAKQIGRLTGVEKLPISNGSDDALAVTADQLAARTHKYISGNINYEDLSESARQQIETGGSAGTINNFPDDEDLTVVNNKLKFKDRNYVESANGKGLGYKILRSSVLFKDQVTEPNTVYEIRYDFDLKNDKFKFPKNCTLKYNGGSLSNGAIQYDNTFIEGHEILNNVSISGSYNYISIPTGMSNIGMKHKIINNTTTLTGFRTVTKISVKKEPTSMGIITLKLGSDEVNTIKIDCSIQSTTKEGYPLYYNADGKQVYKWRDDFYHVDTNEKADYSDAKEYEKTLTQVREFKYKLDTIREDFFNDLYNSIYHNIYDTITTATPINRNSRINYAARANKYKVTKENNTIIITNFDLQDESTFSQPSVSTTGAEFNINKEKNQEEETILLLPDDAFDEKNTIYEIRYDFDLNGKQYEIPENCILKFNGGSFSHGSIGTIACNCYTYIDAPLVNIFKDCILKGWIRNTELQAIWFCVNADDKNGVEGAINNMMFSAYATNCKTIKFHRGAFYIKDVIYIGRDITSDDYTENYKINFTAYWDIVIQGSGSGRTGTVFNMYKGSRFDVKQNAPQGSLRTGGIFDCRFSGNCEFNEHGNPISSTGGDGIMVSFAWSYTIARCTFITTNHSIIITSHAYFINIESCLFEVCNYGVYNPTEGEEFYIWGYGNNNFIKNCTIHGSQTSPIYLKRGHGWGIYDSDIESHNNTLYLGNNNRIYNCRFETNIQKIGIPWIECISNCTIQDCGFYEFGHSEPWFKILVKGNNNYIKADFESYATPYPICSIGKENRFNITKHSKGYFIIDPDDEFVLNGYSNKDNHKGYNYIKDFEATQVPIDYTNKTSKTFNEIPCGTIKSNPDKESHKHSYTWFKVHDGHNLNDKIFSFNFYAYNDSYDKYYYAGSLSLGVTKPNERGNLSFFIPNQNKWFTYIYISNYEGNITESGEYLFSFLDKGNNSEIFNYSIINLTLSDHLLVNAPITDSLIELSNNSNNSTIYLPKGKLDIKQPLAGRMCKLYNSEIFKNELNNTFIGLNKMNRFTETVKYTGPDGDRKPITTGILQNYAYGTITIRSITTDRYCTYNFNRKYYNYENFWLYPVSKSDFKPQFVYEGVYQNSKLRGFWCYGPSILGFNKWGTISLLGFNLKDNFTPNENEPNWGYGEKFDQNNPEDILEVYVQGVPRNDYNKFNPEDKYTNIYLPMTTMIDPAEMSENKVNPDFDINKATKYDDMIWSGRDTIFQNSNYIIQHNFNQHNDDRLDFGANSTIYFKENGSISNVGTLHLNNSLILPQGVEKQKIFKNINNIVEYRSGQILYNSEKNRMELYNGDKWVNLDGSILVN